MPEVKFTTCNAPNVEVPAGTLVRVRDVGIFLRAEFNTEEFQRQPYVSIDTSEMSPEHTYDHATGRRGDCPPYTAAPTVGDSWEVVHIDTGAIVASFKAGQPFPFDNPRRAAEEHAERCNFQWIENVPGMPIISVHLNDGAELYDDRGLGPRHPEAKRLKAAEDMLRRCPLPPGSDLEREVRAFLEASS